MDESNLMQQPPAVNTAPPQAPSSQPSAPQTPIPDSSSGDSNKMILWLLLGLVIVVALVGGIYFFLSMQQGGSIEQPATEQEVVQVTPPDTMDALEKDLNALNVENADSDFASVDQDLEQL